MTALEQGIIPVIHGDVIFDRTTGGTILSTEELFEHMARELHPERILLAGLEDGVFADFPTRRYKVDVLTPDSFTQASQSLGKAHGIDVTGGMESKVKKMLELAESLPDLTIQIFSGKKPGNLKKALLGEHLGTLITSN
jgi:isopentenyl phosphate kinase